MTEEKSVNNKNDTSTTEEKSSETKAEIPLLRSSSDTLKRPAEPEFVLVKDLISGEAMELPTLETDNTLGLTTLTHAFPGAHGLKYKADTGAMRALLIDSTGMKFCPPAGGWGGKTFTVIFKNNPIPVTPVTPIMDVKLRTSSDQNAKRKKMMDDNDSSDSDQGGSGDGTIHHSYTAKQKRMENIKTSMLDDNTTNKTASTIIKDDKDDIRPSDLIILGLPYKFTEKELENYFSQFGKISLCEIKKDNKGTSKGFGFIQFETLESQLRVLTRPYHQLGGRKCEVKIPLSKKGDGKNDFGGIEHAKLFIGRLQEKTSENTLTEFFVAEAKKIDPKATVIDTFIPRPFRSFAFITFSSPKIVRELIKKGDFIIDGSSVSVSSAAPKTTDQGPPLPNYGGYMPPDRMLNDYGHLDWNRMPVQPPTNRFNEQAFSRPYEQRKRTFMETYGSSLGLDSSSSYPPTPGMLPPSSSNGNPGAGSQALASGFETLNLNQLPSNDIMNAFSQFLSSTQQPSGPPRSSPMPPPSSSQPSSRYHSHYSSQQPSMVMRGRHDYGPPGSGRGPSTRTPYSQPPYSRPDDSYY